MRPIGMTTTAEPSPCDKQPLHRVWQPIHSMTKTKNNTVWQWHLLYNRFIRCETRKSCLILVRTTPTLSSSFNAVMTCTFSYCKGVYLHAELSQTDPLLNKCKLHQESWWNGSNFKSNPIVIGHTHIFSGCSKTLADIYPLSWVSLTELRWIPVFMDDGQFQYVLYTVPLLGNNQGHSSQSGLWLW